MPASAFLILAVVSCPSGYGFGTTTSPQPGGVTFQPGSLIIPTDDCYQHGRDNNDWFGPSTNAMVSEQWANDGSACTYYDSTTTPSTLAIPDFAPATGGGYHCWAASTAGYGATAGAIAHTYGLVYLLAKNEIPVHVVLSPTKFASVEPDMVVSAVSPTVNGVSYLTWSAGAFSGNDLTPMSGASVYYRGAPFVVDAAFAQRALALLTTTFGSDATLSDVKIHVARTQFYAPAVAVMDTTPKPMGLLSYSNNGGYQAIRKLLTDAGLTAVLGGEGGTWTTILGDNQGNLQYTWAAGPTTGTNACVAGNCTSLTYTPPASVETRILDAVWAPSFVTADAILNPAVCTGAQGQCLADTCIGPNAWCCYDPAQPALATLPAGTSVVPVSVPTGGTVNYYCPCDLAYYGGGPGTYACGVTNYHYNAYNNGIRIGGPLCNINPWPTAVPTPNPCGGGTTCDVTVSRCLKPCATIADCGGIAGSCVTMPSDPFSGTGVGQVACDVSNLCPVGYTCNGSSVCVPTSTVCDPMVQGTTCGACTADEYCDPVTNHCETRVGCRLECNGPPTPSPLTVWNNLATPSTGKGGMNNLVTTGGTLIATDSTGVVIESSANQLLGTAPPFGIPRSFPLAPTSQNDCPSSVSPDGATVPGGYHPGWNWGSYPPSDMALQFGDFELRPGWVFDMYNAAPQVQPNIHLAIANGGFPGFMVGAPKVSGTIQPGTVIESFAEVYVNQGTSEPDEWAGQHALLTGLLLQNATPPGCNGNALTTSEVSRSSPMPNPMTGLWAQRYYVGTYEWQWTDPTALGLGNAQWLPPWDSYPYTIGHFREYSLGSGVDTNTNLTAGGSWDTDCWLRTGTGDCTGSTPQARTILTAVWASNKWNLIAFSTANATPIAKVFFQTSTPSLGQISLTSSIITLMLANTRLGGVNYSTAAVIQASQGLVAAGTGRPTLAYIGTQDGMVHAICVAAKTGTPASPGTCYGASAGEEVFAFIPPRTLLQIMRAYSLKDWSALTVDGVMRVADVFDYLDITAPTTKVWQTVLLFGTRDSAAVDALVVSNPDPATANWDTNNLRMLWEMNAFNTVPVPGATSGATIVTPSVTALAAVTAGNTTGTGMTTYLLQIAPASTPQPGPLVVATQALTYSKAIPIQASVTVPSAVPPLPTVVGLVSSTTDDTLLVASVDGQMIKYPLTSTSLGAPTVLLDVSGWASGAGITASTPILSSPALARRPLAAGGPADPQIVMVATTGGADWTDNTSTVTQYMVGADVEVSSPAATPWFYGALGTEAITQPKYPPQPVTYPMRGYGQPLVYGTAVAVTATTLHLNNALWPLFPNIYGGVWGAGELFNIAGINTSNTITAPYAFTVTASGAFGGGAGSAMASNGRIVVVGGTQVYDHAMTVPEVALTTPQSLLRIVNPTAGGPGSTRAFQVQLEQEPDR
jgi:hypothetical protein